MSRIETKVLEGLPRRELIEIVLRLEQENANLRAQIRQLQQRVEPAAGGESELAQARRDSSNSSATLRSSDPSLRSTSKPPSSDIVKPPKDKTSCGPAKQGGQTGHRGVNQTPKDRFDRIMPARPAGEFRIKDRVLRLAAQCSWGERSKSRTLARRLVRHGYAIFRFLFDPNPPRRADQSAYGGPPNEGFVSGHRPPNHPGQPVPHGPTMERPNMDPPTADRKQGRSAWQFLQDALFAYYSHTAAPSLLPHAE